MQSFLLKTSVLSLLVFTFIFANNSTTFAAEKERGIIGFKLENITEAFKKQYKITAEKGVVATEIFPGLPAEKAGIKAGDVVVKIGKTDITQTPDLPKALSAAYAGEVLEITILRGKKKMVKKVTLVPVPKQNPAVQPKKK